MTGPYRGGLFYEKYEFFEHFLIFDAFPLPVTWFSESQKSPGCRTRVSWSSPIFEAGECSSEAAVVGLDPGRSTTHHFVIKSSSAQSWGCKLRQIWRHSLERFCTYARVHNVLLMGAFDVSKAASNAIWGVLARARPTHVLYSYSYMFKSASGVFRAFSSADSAELVWWVKKCHLRMWGHWRLRLDDCGRAGAGARYIWRHFANAFVFVLAKWQMATAKKPLKKKHKPQKDTPSFHTLTAKRRTLLMTA